MHGGEYKSKLIHVIRKEESNVHGINSCQTDAVEVDAILVVQKMKKSDTLGTFHDLACLFIYDIENLTDSAIYTAVAFDTYQDISLKNAIRIHQKGD